MKIKMLIGAVALLTSLNAQNTLLSAGSSLSDAVPFEFEAGGVLTYDENYGKGIGFYLDFAFQNAEFSGYSTTLDVDVYDEPFDWHVKTGDTLYKVNTLISFGGGILVGTRRFKKDGRRSSFRHYFLLGIAIGHQRLDTYDEWYTPTGIWGDNGRYAIYKYSESDTFAAMKLGTKYALTENFIVGLNLYHGTHGSRAVFNVGLSF